MFFILFHLHKERADMHNCYSHKSHTNNLFHDYLAKIFYLAFALTLPANYLILNLFYKFSLKQLFCFLFLLIGIVIQIRPSNFDSIQRRLHKKHINFECLAVYTLTIFG